MNNIDTQDTQDQPDYLDYGPEYQAHAFECMAKDLCALKGGDLDVVREYLVRVKEMIEEKL